jgi:peptide/nickel transport system substrate-binding protein
MIPTTTRPGRAAARLGAAALGGLAMIAATPALAERIVLVADPPANESNRFWETSGSHSLKPAMQTLVGHDPVTGEYDDSAIARAWEHNEDFTTWTFELHPEAEFHFGWGPVTAADIVHSYELSTVETSLLSGIENLRGAELEVLDDHTVAFHFEEPRPDFLFAVAGRGSLHVYSMAQYDAEGMEGYDAQPAGTGPMQYVQREIGRGVDFERVESHWSGRDVPFEELELRFVSEPATQLALLLSGEAQIVALPRELQADALEAGFEIIESHGPSMQTAWLLPSQFLLPGEEDLNERLPWLDIRIREAMARAVDGDVLIDVLYDGRAERLVQFTMDERHIGWNQELADRFDELYGYDPERAKELLAEAGYPDSFEEPVIPILVVSLVGSPEFPTMAELMQVFFEDVGFQTEMVEMDWAAFAGLRSAREQFNTHPMRNAPVRPTVIGINTYFTSGGRPVNVIEDPEVEERLDRLRATLDPGERDAQAQEIFRILFEDYRSIPMARITTDVMVDPGRIAGWDFPGVTTAGISHFHLIEPAN